MARFHWGGSIGLCSNAPQKRIPFPNSTDERPLMRRRVVGPAAGKKQTVTSGCSDDNLRQGLHRRVYDFLRPAAFRDRAAVQ
jgi:hypothetical protein